MFAFVLLMLLLAFATGRWRTSGEGGVLKKERGSKNQYVLGRERK
jgi:hypothetical protein